MHELENTEHTPSHTPWWLTALRILLAALIILALADPILNPERETQIAQGPIVAVVDNSWTSGKNWQDIQTYLDTLTKRAIRDNRAMALVATADDDRRASIAVQAPSKIRELAESLKPRPFAPNRPAALQALEKALKDVKAPTIFWLSDGIDHGNANDFAAGLTRLKGDDGMLTMVRANQENAALGLTAETKGSNDLKAKIIRAHKGAQDGRVIAWNAKGNQLGQAKFTFDGSESETETAFNIPLELRNQIARLEIAGENTAGSVYLLDGRSQRQRVGLITGESRDLSQPLLSPLYYVEKALAPYSDLITARDSNVANALDELLKQSPATLVLTDIGKLVEGPLEKLTNWVEDGGVLVRFAGPRLEQERLEPEGEDLLPIRLRRGGRTLGGALSWSTPQSLAPFEENSIFRGLEIPKDVTVNRQVLADPERPTQDTEVWARLQDGTPLVTAAKRKNGWIILFHITANADWSKLPHSGLFVDMLRRIVELSNFSIASPQKEEAGTTLRNSAPATTTVSNRRFERTEILQPVETLDGFGRLSSPSPIAEPISLAQIDKIVPSAKHPPGLYGPTTAMRVINVTRPKSVMTPIAEIESATTTSTYAMSKPVNSKPWVLLAALTLLFADIIATLWLSGKLAAGQNSLRRTKALGSILTLCFALSALTVTDLSAQELPKEADSFALRASLETRLAYVVTGDELIDRTSHDGLSGLSKVIAARTAIEPSDPMGVNVETDELAFFPILYWPVHENSSPLSQKALARLDAYMKQGGMVIFDTRDQQSTFSLGTTNAGSPGTRALRRLIGRLDIPRLEPVQSGHVLTKSFYLLDNFPGRYDGGTLWSEATSNVNNASSRQAQRSDGVSSILITSNDFASAWALGDGNRAIYPVSGGALQREMAFRTGVNIVMYALTGNYKADQVHVPDILQRMGH